MRLKNAFPMQAQMARCFLFVLQTPEKAVASFLPPEINLITRNGFAFWNVVVCRIEGMRPKGFPAWLGVNYWHVAYRLYVRKTTKEGPILEGLYFVRSDCDDRILAAAGRILTDFQFNLAKISFEDGAEARIRVESPRAPMEVILDRSEAPVLAEYSAFGSLDEAARELKYKPRAIIPRADGRVDVVGIVRNEEAWRSRLISARKAEFGFFKGMPVRWELGYEVEPIFYQWKRAVTVD